MNDEELRQLRVATDATALQALFSWHLQVIPALLFGMPEEQRTQSVKVMLRKLAETRADYLQMTFPEMSWAESDLWAAEAQEAFDRRAKEAAVRMFSQSLRSTTFELNALGVHQIFQAVVPRAIFR